MSGTPAIAGVEAILLDIEGTTTPLTFVTGALFPYARTHLRSHLDEHAGSHDYESVFAALRNEHAAALRDGEHVQPWNSESAATRQASVAAFVEWLMDRDRKSTALKELQGRIWEEGYRRGEIVSEVFPDVAPALRRWHERNLSVSIFSSGSVLAQQLLFGQSSAGDLTGFLHEYFDTRVGPKVEAASYRRIVEALARAAQSVLFLSDVTRELDAAGAAGLQVRLVVRPGNAPVPERHQHAVIRSFDDLVFD